MSNWKKYIIEFLSVFIAVFLAFALSNWSENRRGENTEMKILSEISNGLKKDLNDIQINTKGHEYGIKSCEYWRNVVNEKQFSQDSIHWYYFGVTRDFTSVQNTPGYESLKSKGLEILKNDSLRLEIISLYEYDFNSLKKFEEEYSEMQFHDSYFHEINSIISPYFNFDTTGSIKSITTPLVLNIEKKNTVLSILWKIEANRKSILPYYSKIEKKVNELIENIDKELDR